MKTSPKLSWLQSDTTLRSFQLIVGALAIGLIFWKLQFSTNAICCGDFDGYYHVKWCHILWESIRHRDLRPTFYWLPLTSLNPRDYADHHFLFHIFQIPFVRFQDPRLGAKISAALFGSLALFSCYWLLIKFRIRYVLVWLVALLACSAPFIFRMNMGKAPPFAIIYLVIAIYLFFTRKYWPLLPLAMIFTLTYDMFVLLVPATVFWVLVIGWSERRFEWRPLMWVALGIAAGLLFNPYFPRTLHLLFEHFTIKLTSTEFNTKVGQEWYPYDSWEFFGNSLVACVSMVVGYIAFEPHDRPRSHHPLFFLLFSTTLMLMTARWKRIAEYWPPFAVMFAAFSVQPWLEGSRSSLTRLPSDMLEELQPFFDRDSGPSEQERDWRELIGTVGMAVLVLLLGVVLYFNLKAEVKEIGGSEKHDYYKAGADWLRANVPPQQIIFNTDWDDFPRLFYYDSTHYYVSGLDPSYLFDKSPDLSRLYDRITLGKEDDPGPLIRDRFGARYVFSDNSHHDFFSVAQQSGWFDIVYEDEQCTIMHIRDEKAPPESNDDALPEPTLIEPSSTNSGKH